MKASYSASCSGVASAGGCQGDWIPSSATFSAIVLRSEAGIDKEAVIVGVLDRMEIWDRATYERYEQTHAAAYRDGTLKPGEGR